MSIQFHTYVRWSINVFRKQGLDCLPTKSYGDIPKAEQHVPFEAGSKTQQGYLRPNAYKLLQLLDFTVLVVGQKQVTPMFCKVKPTAIGFRPTQPHVPKLTLLIGNQWPATDWRTAFCITLYSCSLLIFTSMVKCYSSPLVGYLAYSPLFSGLLPTIRHI